MWRWGVPKPDTSEGPQPVDVPINVPREWVQRHLMTLDQIHAWLDTGVFVTDGGSSAIA